MRFRFGTQLSAEQLKIVHLTSLHYRRSADFIKRVEIANGDDPIVAFRADLP